LNVDLGSLPPDEKLIKLEATKLQTLRQPYSGRAVINQTFTFILGY
jgi:hypothetical protein